MSKADDNNTVKISYTGKLSDGNIFDSSEGKDPLEFTIGNEEIISGLEEAVKGMEEGEEKSITIQPENAYGERRDDLYKELNRSDLPEDLVPEEGQQLVSKLSDGREIPLQVTEVKDETIVVDANHPLAGKELTFDIKLEGIS